MKEKISLLLAGLVSGALIASIAPVQAHHGDDYKALNRKIKALQAKTQYLDADGFYNNIVVSPQVVSICEDGAAATWEQIPVEGLEEFSYLYDCDTELSRQEMRQRARSVLKAYK